MSSFQRDQLYVNGFTVLETVYSPEELNRLRDRRDDLFELPDLYRHPRVLEFARSVLGEDFLLAYMHFSDGNPPDLNDQVHSDSRLLFPETFLSTPPFGLVVGVPLVDTTEANGATELWPGGTYLMPLPLDLPLHAAAMTSFRLTMKAGSVVVRDLRTWHKAWPNISGEPSPSFTLVYTRPWYRLEHVPPPRIRQDRWDQLDEEARRMLRLSKRE